MARKNGLRISETDLMKITGGKNACPKGSGKGWDEPEKTDDKKSKRKGVDEKPILLSLKTCVPEVHIGDGFVTLVFRGTRMFSLNEIYAIKEYRPYVDYAYKNAWHKLIRNAVLIGSESGKLPDFSGGCEISVYRQSVKKVDRDALAIMFKYAIDGLRYAKIIPDDNSDIVKDIRSFQKQGDFLVILRIDKRNDPEEDMDEKTLIETPTSVWISK